MSSLSTLGFNHGLFHDICFYIYIYKYIFSHDFNLQSSECYGGGFLLRNYLRQSFLAV